jgi:hypothetical protein
MMARRIPEDERREVWERLERRLTAFDGKPAAAPRRTDVYEWGYGAFPGGFPAHLLVVTQLSPDERMLSAIREGMERLSDPALFFLAKEVVQGDDDEGPDWHISASELNCQTLSAVSPALEYYLYSVQDAWAIYFHHEGFAYCGGAPAFLDALRERCEIIAPSTLLRQV